MNDLKLDTENAISLKDLTLENRLEIIGEGLRKKYLSRLSEMEIARTDGLPPLEDDLIDNIRLYLITEMVYEKGFGFDSGAEYDARLHLRVCGGRGNLHLHDL